MKIALMWGLAGLWFVLHGWFAYDTLRQTVLADQPFLDRLQPASLYAAIGAFTVGVLPLLVAGWLHRHWRRRERRRLERQREKIDRRLERLDERDQDVAAGRDALAG